MRAVAGPSTAYGRRSAIDGVSLLPGAIETYAGILTKNGTWHGL
jgi:hypothetical protein